MANTDRVWFQAASSWMFSIDRWCKAACLVTALFILGTLWLQGVAAGPARHLLLRVAVMAVYTITASIVGYLLRSINVYESLILLSMEACVLVIAQNVTKTQFGDSHHKFAFHPIRDHCKACHAEEAEDDDAMLEDASGLSAVDDLYLAGPNGDLAQTISRMRRWWKVTVHFVGGRSSRTLAHPHTLVASCMCMSVGIMDDFVQNCSRCWHQIITEPHHWLVVSIVGSFSMCSYLFALFANLIMLGIAILASSAVTFCIFKPFQLLVSPGVHLTSMKGFISAFMSIYGPLITFISLSLQILLSIAVFFLAVTLSWLKRIFYYLSMFCVLCVVCCWHVLDFCRKKVKRVYVHACLQYHQLQAWRKQRAANQTERVGHEKQKQAREAAQDAHQPRPAAVSRQPTVHEARQHRQGNKKGRQTTKHQPPQPQPQPQQPPAVAVPTVHPAPQPPEPNPVEPRPAAAPNKPQQAQRSGGRKGKARGSPSAPSPPSRTTPALAENVPPMPSPQPEPTRDSSVAAAPSAAPTSISPPIAAAKPATAPFIAAPKTSKGKKQRQQSSRSAAPISNIILHPPTPPLQPTTTAIDAAPVSQSLEDPGTMLERLGDSLSWVPVSWRRKKGTAPAPHNAAQHHAPSTSSAPGNAANGSTQHRTPAADFPAPSVAATVRPVASPAVAPPPAIPPADNPATRPDAGISRGAVPGAVGTSKRGSSAKAAAAPMVTGTTSRVAVGQDREAAQKVQNMSDHEEDEQLDEDQSLCVVCLANRRNVGLLHGKSMHLCLCTDCSRLFTKGSACPLCRQPVVDIVEIFM